MVFSANDALVPVNANCNHAPSAPQPKAQDSQRGLSAQAITVYVPSVWYPYE